MEKVKSKQCSVNCAAYFNSVKEKLLIKMYIVPFYRIMESSDIRHHGKAVDKKLTRL